jgi:tetratricopeptide (TPR) repeat protein
MVKPIILRTIARILLVFGLLVSNNVIERAYADEAMLDLLFLQLKYAPDEATSRIYENEIWREWFQSGDELTNGLMQEAMRKRGNYDFAGAVEALSKIIELNPAYAEAWNQRATVYYYQANYQASLVDIAKTLALEPRHFGALSGRAMIRLYQSKPALARQNIIEASKIHPYLKERSLFPDAADQ